MMLLLVQPQLPNAQDVSHRSLFLVPAVESDSGGSEARKLAPLVARLEWLHGKRVRGLERLTR